MPTAPSNPSRSTSSIWVFLTAGAFLLLPDVVFGLLHPAYMAGISTGNLLMSVLLAFLITFARPRLFGQLLLSFLFLLQATELIHFRYFGVFYSGYEISLMFREFNDTVSAALDMWRYLLAPLFVSCLFFAIAIATHARHHRKGRHIPYLGLVGCIALLTPFAQTLAGKPSQKFQPNISALSMKNGYYAASYFMGRQIRLWTGKAQTLPDYKPYVLAPVETEKPNIVILMGESTSYANMGMFGYARDTTPDLGRYSGQPNFIQARGISSAVSTRVSLSLFYNIVNEPDNPGAIGSMAHSLYRLAKQQGYRTHYITTQYNAGGLTYAMSVKDIDTWKDRKDLSIYPGEHDDRLLLALKDLDLDYHQPNFVTLHMLSAHAPYTDNYPRSGAVYPDTGQGQHDYTVNSYDNSILYTQKLIADIYAYFDALGQPVYIFFVPDHGEAMGQHGRYGHNFVQLDSALVPILVYGSHLAPERMAAMRERLGCLTNHYLVGKEIARLLGYTLENPNEVEDTYYLNGTSAFGEAGFMSYSLKEQRQRYCPP